MNFKEKDIYHIYNRGNNSQKIFFEKANYLYFLKLTQKFISPYTEILAWCLMPNHFHFMIYANVMSVEQLKERTIPLQRLSEGLRLLLSNYTKAINSRYHRKGSLFQQKVKTFMMAGIIMLNRHSIIYIKILRRLYCANNFMNGSLVPIEIMQGCEMVNYVIKPLQNNC